MTPETRLRNDVHEALGNEGVVLFRNNVGAAKITDCNCHVSRVVKYGVCYPGGADLIGFRPVKITPAMVGKTVAVFVAVETKVKNRQCTPEQRNFLARVREAGGIACESRVLADTVREVCG